MDMKTRQERTEKFFQRCLEVYSNKGADYNPTGVAFKDVRGNAEAMGLRDLQVVGVFMSKHYAAVQSWIKDPDRKTSEPIVGRLMDLANYCAMLAVMSEGE